MTEITCKHCGNNYLQLGKPFTHLFGDERDPTNPHGTRGNWIEIPCQCEECHKITTINVSFHKGQVLVDFFPISTVDYEEISRIDPKK